ncbi:MAG TPA: phage tail protein [Chitinophagaceae bacterium]|nr:phage tail protein [Chitinophagaceae bacterium]
MADSAPVAGGYYPPVGFHFKVEFQDIGNNNDTRFQSVSGLNVEYDTESFKEGGENRFEHKLPVRTKYPDLSLKRGMLTDSNVIKWCLDAFNNRTFRPATIIIKLLNEKHEPLKTWTVNNAWPKKWAVSDFNAQENALVVETLEMCYSYFTIQ